MITLSRTIPGIGDAIMMEPTIRELSLHQTVNIITQFPDLFSGMYKVVDRVPPGSRLLDMGHDGYCPCASYELDRIDEVILKGRVEIFLDQIGVVHAGHRPRLKLIDSEIAAAAAARSQSDRPRIGLSLTASDYGNDIDGWRDYPYHRALIQHIDEWADVVWIHNEPPPLDAEWDAWSLRELMVTVASLDALIAVDSGPAHIAGALGVPLFGLFGPTDPNLRISVYPQVHTIPMYEKCGSAYCWYKPCKFRYCMATLSPKWIDEWVKHKLELSISVDMTIPSGSEMRRKGITA